MIIICDLKLLRCSLYKHHCLFLTLCCQTCWISLLNVVSDCYNLKNRSISFLSFLSLPACCQLWKQQVTHPVLSHYDCRGIKSKVSSYLIMLWPLCSYSSFCNQQSPADTTVKLASFSFSFANTEFRRTSSWKQTVLTYRWQIYDILSKHWYATDLTLNLNLLSCICPQAQSLRTNNRSYSDSFDQVYFQNIIIRHQSNSSLMLLMNRLQGPREHPCHCSLAVNIRCLNWCSIINNCTCLLACGLW